MLEKSFIFNGTYNSLKGFGDQFNAREVQKGCFLIEDENIHGWLRQIEVEPGLYIQTWDVHINCPLIIKKESDSSVLHHYYSISYFLSPQILSISIEDDEISIVNNLQRINILFSKDASFMFHYQKGTSIKNITLIFTSSWLQKHINDTSGKELDMFHVFEDKKYIFLNNKFTNSEEIESKELFKEVNTFQSLLTIKAHVYDLLYRVLFTVSELKKENQEWIPTSYSMLVKEVERIINSSLTTTMPSIKELAKSLFVSESTLKRQFKKVYGVNIYHYYLEMKMKKAMEMLTQKKISVSQVASSLGYENVSHFTALFKRFYGKLPSHAQKSSGNL